MSPSVVLLEREVDGGTVLFLLREAGEHPGWVIYLEPGPESLSTYLAWFPLHGGVEALDEYEQFG